MKRKQFIKLVRKEANKLVENYYQEIDPTASYEVCLHFAIRDLINKARGNFVPRGTQFYNKYFRLAVNAIYG